MYATYISMPLIVLLALLLVDAGPQTSNESVATPETVIADAKDYRLGPGDTITVNVFGVPELSRTGRISNSGKLHFPSLGILRVVNMTPSELELDIAHRLEAAGMVKDAVVQVHLAQGRAQPVYVLGEVMTPGQFVITKEMRVLDLVVLSQGFNEVASKVGYLYRRTLKDPDSSQPNAPAEATTNDEVIEIDFDALATDARPEQNLLLRGGDILYVPVGKKNRYFVVGDVLQTGGFEMFARDSITVTQALARAGGPARTAKVSKGLLVRYDEAGNQMQYGVDFTAILRGRKPDMEVRPNDILFIPGSSIKTLGYGLLNIIPSSAGRAVTMR